MAREGEVRRVFRVACLERPLEPETVLVTSDLERVVAEVRRLILEGRRVVAVEVVG
jgi:hypothetical protein